MVMTVTFIVYLLVLIGLSAYVGRTYIKDIGDFYLGGRRIGIWGTALSSMATGRSAASMIGHAGMAFTLGVHAHWISFGFVLADFIGLKYFAPRMRSFTEKTGCITVPDYFEARFQDKTRILRIVSLIILAIFMMGYIAGQVIGIQLTVSAILGWPPLLGSLVAFAVILIYCLLGGYVAVIWSDIIQACLMLFAMIVVPIAGLIAVGGPANLFRQLAAINPDFIQVLPAGRFPWALGMLFGVAFVQWGFAHTVLRWMSIKNPKELQIAAPINFISNTIVAFGGILIGWVGRVMFLDISNIIAQDAEMVFFNVAIALMPAFLIGIISAGIVAAMMSSADSQLIVASSSLVRDLYQQVIRRGKEVDRATMLWIGRASIVVLMLGALMWALFWSEGVFWTVFFATAGLGGGIGTILIISLFWRRVNFWGALAGMVSGPIIALVWKLNDTLRGWMFEGLPAMIGAAILIVVVSLLTQKPDQNVEETIDAMS